MRSPISIDLADEADAASIAALRTAAADQLTRDFGRGHWSSATTEKGVLGGLQTSRLVVARSGKKKAIVGTLRLTTKKPWAIDVAYFTSVARPVYLLDMAVAPAHQHHGIGRALLDGALAIAKTWPGDAIRLDAYDAAAGAGPFYAKCGWQERGRVTYRSTPLIYYEFLLP